MSDLPSKPQMPKPAPPKPPGHRPPVPDDSKTWVLWIAATVIAPAMAGSLVMTNNAGKFGSAALCILAAFAHLIMSEKLSDNLAARSGGSGCMIQAGGWVLIVGSYFVGCMSMLSSKL